MNAVNTYFSTGKTAAFFFFFAGGADAGWEAEAEAVAGWEAGWEADSAAGAALLRVACWVCAPPFRIPADTGYPAGKATPAAARAASASRHPLFLRPPGLRPSALFFCISAILKERVVQ